MWNSSDKVQKEKEHPDREIKKKQKDTEKQGGKPVTKSRKVGGMVSNADRKPVIFLNF